jgi:DNA-binding SARP family transcriptional activator/tetratricopeptide (TPR) repeat protein
MPRLQLLGTACCQVAERRHELPASVPGALLAYLATRGEWVARETLLALIWPERSDADAQHNLRVTLHRMRQLLSRWGLADALQAERTRLRVQLPSDVAALRAAVSRGDWADALALHQGTFLAGFVLRGFEVLEEWVAVERDALTAAWRQAARREAERLEQAGQPLAASQVLQQLLENDLLEEDLLQALLRLAARGGDRALALDTYGRYVARASAELGLSPLPATRSWAEALQAQVPSAVAPAPPLRAELPPALQGQLLAGRDRERAWLVDLPPGLALVSGEPGQGKTALVAVAWPQALRLDCQEGQGSVPLEPVARWLSRAWPELRLQPRAEALRPVLSRLLPELAEGEVFAPGDGASLLAALQELLLAHPHGVWVDDLQWADDTTWHLLQMLASQAGVRLLASFRPTELPPDRRQWLQEEADAGRLQQLTLAPLDAQALQQIVAELTAGQDSEGLVSWLAAHSGGNPYFAIESLRLQWAEGRVTAVQGPLHLPVRLPVRLPVHLAALVRRRVQALDEATQRVLGIAAVLGDLQDLELLAHTAGLSPWAVAEAVSQAQASGLVRERRFAHDLTRQWLYADLPEARRQLLHAACVRLQAAHWPPQRLAHHAWLAGDVPAAVAATVRASVQERSRGLQAAAQQRVDEALTRLRAAEQDADALFPGLAASLLVEAGRGDFQHGAYDACHARCGQALQALPTPALRAEALVLQGDVLMHQGQLSRVPALIAAAEESDPDTPDLLMLRLKHFQALGEHERCVPLLQSRIAQLRRLAPGEALASMLSTLGCVHDLANRNEEALPCHQEALGMAQRLKLHYVEMQVVLNVLITLQALGRMEDAFVLGERALRLPHCDATDWLLNNLAWLYLQSGRLLDAERLYAQVGPAASALLRCVVCAKRLELASRLERGSAELQTRAEHLLQAMSSTEGYQGQAVGIIALLDHAAPALQAQARAFVRPQPLNPGLQARLDDALQRHGGVGSP